MAEKVYWLFNAGEDEPNYRLTDGSDEQNRAALCFLCINGSEKPSDHGEVLDLNDAMARLADPDNWSREGTHCSDIWPAEIGWCEVTKIPASVFAALEAEKELAVLEEREACAVVADDEEETWSGNHDIAAVTAGRIAAAIRARSGGSGGKGEKCPNCLREDTFYCHGPVMSCHVCGHESSD